MEEKFLWGAIKIYVLDKADFQIIFSRTKKTFKKNKHKISTVLYASEFYATLEEKIKPDQFDL